MPAHECNHPFPNAAGEGWECPGCRTVWRSFVVGEDPHIMRMLADHYADNGLDPMKLLGWREVTK